MNWLANLSKTYDDHAKVVGQFETKKNGKEYALIPISHTTQTAHIEVHLNASGEIVNAKVVDKTMAVRLYLVRSLQQVVLE